MTTPPYGQGTGQPNNQDAQQRGFNFGEAPDWTTAYPEPFATAPVPDSQVYPGVNNEMLPSQKLPKNGFALAALIVGIVGVAASLTILGVFISWLISIVAIILGVIGLIRANKYVQQRKGMSIAGLILGGVNLAALVGLVFLIGSILSGSTMEQLGQCANMTDSVAQQECITEVFEQLGADSHVGA